MRQTPKTASTLLCPSTNPIGPDAQVFGVLTGSAADEFRVGYLTEVLPATPELLAVAAPAKPTEVFRAAAPCVERAANIGMAQTVSSRFVLRRCWIQR